MKRETIESLVYSFGIIVLLALTLRTAGIAEGLSCDQCIIEFKDKTVTEQKYSESFSVPVALLFYPYAYDGVCTVGWDPVQGFINLGGRE